MYHTINLANYERWAVEKTIEVYKLPLEFAQGPDESTSIDDDYFLNHDTNERLYLEDGLAYILKAINSDNRKLFTEEIDPGQQVALLRVMAELGVTTETTWLKHDLRVGIPKWQRRIELPLEGRGKNGEKYKLVAERVNSMPGHDEIDIVIEDRFGTVIQDIVRVEQTIRSRANDPIKHENKTTTVKVYKDEYNEDYTDIFHIHVYDDAEEDTNY